MKKQLFIIPFLALAFLANAQDKTAMKYAATITKEDASTRLNILAADGMEGRETGKAGALRAAEYIKSQFVSFGLKGPVNNSSYFQMLDLKEKSLDKREIAVTGKTLEFLKDYYILPGTFNDTKANYTEFVFVGYGIISDKYDDLTNADLTGKVAIVLPGEPMVDGKSLITGTTKMSDWSTSRNKKLAALKAKNPVAIITLSNDMARMQNAKAYFERPSLVLGKETANQNLLNLYFSKEAINNLISKSDKNIDGLTNSIKENSKPVTFGFFSDLSVDINSKINPLEAKNVLGFMEGSDAKLKSEILVVTAHYDHIGVGEDGDVYNGADDDGSGTTGVLEIAEAFSKAKKAGKGPKRSILFMTVVGEEKGLLGSEWYSENPVFPLENTITDLNIDMIGRVGELYKGKQDSANYVYVIGSEKLSSTLKEISEKTNKTYTNMVLDYKYDEPTDPNRFYYRSDHYNFAKHGIPIIFYFNGVHEDYHKKTDEVKKINFPLLAKRAQLVFYTAWDLANRAERPKVDRENDMKN